MFISEAFAQNGSVAAPVQAAPISAPIDGGATVGAVATNGATVPANAPDPVMANVVLIGMLFMIFYMLVWRPQQQRMKKHKEMMDNLRKGDVVVTAGGIIATITKVVADDEVELQLADGVKVRAVKNTLVNVLVPTSDKGVAKTEAKNNAVIDDTAKEPKKSRKKAPETEKITPQVAKPKGKKSDGKAGPALSIVAPASSLASSDVPQVAADTDTSDDAAKSAVNS